MNEVPTACSAVRSFVRRKVEHERKSTAIAVCELEKVDCLRRNEREISIEGRLQQAWVESIDNSGIYYLRVAPKV